MMIDLLVIAVYGLTMAVGPLAFFMSGYYLVLTFVSPGERSAFGRVAAGWFLVLLICSTPVLLLADGMAVDPG